MIVLSKGYKLPETGEFGDVWFPALEDNIERVNLHNHDGVNSEKISGISLIASSATILAAAFSLVGIEYRATVTVPSGGQVDNYKLTFRDPTTKETIYLKTEKLSANQYYVFTNIVQDFEVLYGV